MDLPIIVACNAVADGRFCRWQSIVILPRVTTFSFAHMLHAAWFRGPGPAFLHSESSLPNMTYTYFGDHIQVCLGVERR